MVATRKERYRYSQNASIFMFIDAPVVLQPVDLDGLTANALGASEASTTGSDPAVTPRAWWKANAERTAAIGLEDSLQMLRDLLQQDRYDGVFGFSQGAAMATVLAALLEKPHSYPPFLVNDQPPHPPLQFCVAVSGFKVNDPISNEIYGQSYATPTLHVIGKTDVIVVEERSKVLLDLSANPRVEEHEGGHFVPSKANWRNFLREYIRDPLGKVPSPSPGGASQPGSGIVTPAAPSANL
ncbi:hypothetical protein HYDPIDRAFT_27248 [Hydnomerulius pinastri MD-312]|nr:hypothetical protein HYDPIDRAFT_27248 [Hydnomerulius pinastri MD-312]